MTASALLVEDFALSGDGDNLFWLHGNPSEMQLLLFLASCADSPRFGSARSFDGHHDAALVLSEIAVDYLRSSWAARVGEPQLFADVPRAVPALADVPDLPRGVPRYFVLDGPPKDADVERLKRLARPRYTERVALFPAAMPRVVLQILQREGFFTTTRIEWEEG